MRILPSSTATELLVSAALTVFPPIASVAESVLPDHESARMLSIADCGVMFWKNCA